MKKAKYKGITCYNLRVKLGRSDEISKENNLLILETNHEPDYYARAHFPPNQHQSNWRLFLLVKKHINCFQDIVLKKAYQINKMLKTDMEIMPGQIEVAAKTYQCIRINLNNTDLLKTIITELENTGVSFVKDKKMHEFETEVFFKRYTELIEMQQEVFKDSKIYGHYFFPIENIIEFDVFEKGIEKIKYSCNFHMFDAFLAFMFVDDGKGQDFIGIFSNHCDENRFQELKENIKLTFD